MSRMVLLPVSGILVEHRQADGDLQRSGVRHAALFALRHIVFQLQAHGIAAAVAEGDDVLVERAAAVAQNVAGMERIGLDGRAASRVPASGAQVVQPFEVAALALPVADRVIDELQLAQAAEVRDRENAFENALQTRVVALARQQFHLQKALIRLLLNLDQVRNRESWS